MRKRARTGRGERAVFFGESESQLKLDNDLERAKQRWDCRNGIAEMTRGKNLSAFVRNCQPIWLHQLIEVSLHGILCLFISVVSGTV